MNTTSHSPNAISTKDTQSILIVSATDRPASTSLAVSRQLENVMRGLGSSVEVLDLAALPPGFFSPAAYASCKDTHRQEVRPWLAASGLLFVVPEYHGSYPGALKHYLDLLPFPAALAGKVAAFVGLAPGQLGGINAVTHLAALCSSRHCRILREHVLIPGADTQNAEATFSPATDDRLINHCAALLASLTLLNTKKLKVLKKVAEKTTPLPRETRLFLSHEENHSRNCANYGT
jgi:NAD(P)H-dependent FMN reductase